MPADAIIPLSFGSGGLNLRDALHEVQRNELTDGLNWRLDERGALVKRLGIAQLGSGIGQDVYGVGAYRPSSGTSVIVVVRADGSVQTTPETGTWTTIAAAGSMAPNTIVNMVQYGDTLVLLDGVNVPRTWNGTVWGTLASAPAATYGAVWRNRLWLARSSAQPRRVWWSRIGDLTDFTTYPNDYVDLLGPSVITGLFPSPTPGSFGNENADGILVFKRTSSHRITDDSDNTGGVVTGGANVTIDAGMGAVSQRSCATVLGRVFLLGADGIYSTDGHSPLRLESGKLGNLFATGLAQQQVSNAVAVSWANSYMLAITRAGEAANALVFELYAGLPRDNTGNHPILAHAVPVAGWVIYPNVAGDRLYLVHPTSRVLARWGSGGTDLGTAITAYARTGAMDFGTSRPKRLRRIRVDGRGSLSIGASVDFAAGVGFAGSFALSTALDLWSLADVWNVGTWGPASGSAEGVAWYDVVGRYFTFQVSETSSTVGAVRSRLGIATIDAGGAAVYRVEARLTPLEEAA